MLLDVCGAGTAANYQLTQAIEDPSRRAWVIAACAQGEDAFGARFTTAIAKVLERLQQGRLDVSPTLRHVPVETIAAEAHRELLAADPDAYTQTVVRTTRLTAWVEPPPFFVNPAHTDDPREALRRRLDVALWELAAQFDVGLDAAHFFTRASGAPPHRAAYSGCLFSGREDELAAVRDWLEGDGAILLLTGGPGSGKSALLGVVACLAHPQLTPLGAPLLSRISPAQRPARRYPGLVAVHARRRGLEQIMASVAAQLNLSPPQGWGWTIDDFVMAIAAASEPVIFLCDALDEAEHPERVITWLLRPLLTARRRDGRRACRILLGTRNSVEGFDHLRHSAAAVGGDHIDLDTSTSPDRLADGLARYVDDLLAAQPHFADEDVRGPLVSRISGALKSAPQSAFLVAGLYANHLGTGRPLSRDEAVGAGERTPTDLPAMLRLHAEQQRVARPWAVHLLAVLAHAHGDGMPRDIVHAVLCGVLRRRAAGPLPTLEDVDEALADVGFSLRTSPEIDGRQLYRFFHESLNEYFGSAAEELPEVSPDDVLAGLLDAVPRQGSAADSPMAWELAAPYVRRHLLDHARRAPRSGMVDRMLLDPGFLVHTADGTVARIADAAVSRSARRVVRAYEWSGRQTTTYPAADTSDLRLELLALNLVRFRMPLLAAAVGDVAFASQLPLWWPSWATGTVPESVLSHVITRDDLDSEPDEGAHSAVPPEDGEDSLGPDGLDVTAVLVCGDEEPVVALGDSTGRIRVISLSGDDVCHDYDTAPGHPAPVRHILSARNGDKPLLVTCCDAGRMCVWDRATGDLLHSAELSGARITAGVVVQGGGPPHDWRHLDDEGPPYIVWLRTDGTLTDILLDGSAREDRDVGFPPDRTGGLVRTLDDSRAVRLAGCPSTPAYDELTGSGVEPRVDYHAVGDRIMATTSGWDYELLVHDVKDNWRVMHRLTAHHRSMWMLPHRQGATRVITLARDRHVKRASIARVGRRTIAASAHQDGIVRCWDLDVAPSTGHRGEPGQVDGLAWSSLDGHPVLVSVDAFGAANVWAAEDGEELIHVSGLGRAKQAATATVGGHPHLVFHSDDGPLVSWDLDSVSRVAAVAVDTPVTCMAAGPADAILTGSSSGDIELRDAATLAVKQVFRGLADGAKLLASATRNGVILVAGIGADRALSVWCDGRSDSPTTRIDVGTARPTALACGFDGERQLVAVGFQTGDIEVWAAADGSRVMGWQPQKGIVSSLAFDAAAGRPVALLSTHGDQSLRTWHLDDATEAGRVSYFPERMGPIAVHDGQVAIGFGTDVAVLRRTQGHRPRAAADQHGPVRVSHVIAWCDGELMCQDPDASSWDVYTLADWEAGEPPTVQAPLGAFPRTASAAELAPHVAEFLDTLGFDTVSLEPGTVSIGVIPGEWHEQPLFYVHTYPTPDAVRHHTEVPK